MTNYKIWKPEHTGHAPPNWREGMEWALDGGSPRTSTADPAWLSTFEYSVPAEALNSPNDDTEDRMRDYAIKTLLQEGEDALNGLVRELREYPAEELAKHGITLAPERDWARELYFDVLETGGYAFLRNTELDQRDDEAIELLRTRFEQMLAERSKRDA